MVAESSPWDQLDDAPGEEQDDLEGGVRPAFAPTRSFRLALQETQAETSGAATRNRAGALGRRTPLPGRPLILPDFPHIARVAPSQRESVHLQRSITARDIAIIQALHDYRYLDTLQIKDLFFPSLRSAQIRIKALKSLGLIYCWRMIQHPGMTRLHSLLLLSPRGGRILAAIRADDPPPYVERARQASAYHWRATHDLEANQFFVSMAVTCGRRWDVGLKVWRGEETLRAEYRQRLEKRRERVPAPDGFGILLTRTSGRIVFELEWDRGTESRLKIRQKIRAYVDHWSHYRDAKLHHILFVVPSSSREDLVREMAIQQNERAYLGNRLSFWLTTAKRLYREGPLGPIWCAAALTKAEEDARSHNDSAELADPDLLPRLSLTQLPAHPPLRSEGSAFIGDGFWWLGRPGGGEVA